MAQITDERTAGERWRDYVRAVTGDASGAEVARRTGIHQTTVSRWLRSDEQPSFTSVLTLARSYDVSVLGALVEASYITEEEARSRPQRKTSLRNVSTAELMRELARRADGAAA